jgi:hypothetical protein
VTSVTEPAIVNRKIAQLQITVFNSAGEEVRQLAQTEADSMVLASNVQISSSVITPSYTGGTNSTTTLSLTSGASFAWDGTNDAGQIVGPGQYYFEIKSTDGQGNSAEFTQSIVVMPTSGKVTNSGITVYPNPTNPAVYGNLVTFKDPTASLSLSARFYTLAGELVTLPPLVNKGSGLYTLDISKLASGLYVVDIQMINPTGGRQQQVTRLAIFH